MKNIMTFCFDLRRAEQLEPQPSMEYTRPKILNMDTTSPQGLQVSFANGIVNSNKVDLIVSNYFLSGAALFTDMHNGKAFTIIRHPVELAISLFHYRRKANYERSYRDELNRISFHHYVSHNDYVDNWMVRQLTGTLPWVPLTTDHLDHAKLVMKHKVFVGVISDMDETLRQLKHHYGWNENQENCVSNSLLKPINTNSHPDIQGGRGGRTWKVVIEKEKFDMALYYYGLELFEEQRARYPLTPEELAVKMAKDAAEAEQLAQMAMVEDGYPTNEEYEVGYPHEEVGVNQFGPPDEVSSSVGQEAEFNPFGPPEVVAQQPSDEAYPQEAEQVGYQEETGYQREEAEASQENVIVERALEVAQKDEIDMPIDMSSINTRANDQVDDERSQLTGREDLVRSSLEPPTRGEEAMPSVQEEVMEQEAEIGGTLEDVEAPQDQAKEMVSSVSEEATVESEVSNPSEGEIEPQEVEENVAELTPDQWLKERMAARQNEVS